MSLGTPPYRVLLLCAGNSARSIMAAALLNHQGQDRFIARSVGSQPTGRVDRRALTTLARHGIPVHEPHRKRWDEFATPSAAALDFVITVCDNAAGEICPAQLAIARAFAILERRVGRHPGGLARLAPEQAVRSIGHP